ncbi:MAG: LacI family DNA-binding transcriptional regulator [Acidimicrobiales bacterium]
MQNGLHNPPGGRVMVMRGQNVPDAGGLPQPTRIYDIAERVGVSLTTVSAVLTGNRPVAAATRERVLRAIEEMGYRGNASARALVRGNTRTLALLIPPLAPSMTVIQMEFIADVVQTARSHGYDVLVSVASDEDDGYLRLVAEQRVDGFLLLEVFLRDRRVERLRSACVPFLTIGRAEDTSVCSWVDIDFHWIMESFVQHLAELGHQRVALFNSSLDLYDRGYGPAVRSQEGFLAACAALGVDGTVLHCERQPDAGLQETAGLVDREPRVTAFVVANELVMAGIYHALSTRGLRIPDDVSVIAMIDRLSARAFSPLPVAIQHPVVEMAQIAVEFLVEELNEPGRESRGKLIRPPIEYRTSTGPVPVAGGGRRTNARGALAGSTS